MPDQAGWLQLLRLVRPALPVGAYSYSRGLEHAVETGWVRDEDSAREWIVGVLEDCVVPLDAAVLVRLHRAFDAGDLDRARVWEELLCASRESHELRLEDAYMGQALLKLLCDLGVEAARPWKGRAGYVTAFALAAVHHRIDCSDAVSGYLWAWAEGQVSAALRLVPLGQTSGQRMLSAVISRIPHLCEAALSVEDTGIGALAPALALGSALHETQYSRLFRS